MNKFMDFDEEVVLPVGKTKTMAASVTVTEPNSEVIVPSTLLSAGNLQMGLLPLVEMERQYIMSVLEHTGGNKSEAAKILGITIKSVYNKLHEYEAKGHSLGVASIGKK